MGSGSLWGAYCPLWAVVIFSMAPLNYGIMCPFPGIERRGFGAVIEGSR